jgi:hypothetical protein
MGKTKAQPVLYAVFAANLYCLVNRAISIGRFHAESLTGTV